MEVQSIGTFFFVCIGIILVAIGIAVWNPQPSPDKQLMIYAQRAINKVESDWFGTRRPSNAARCYKLQTGQYVIVLLNRNFELPLSQWCKVECDVLVVAPGVKEVRCFRMQQIADSRGMLPLPIGNGGDVRFPYIEHRRYTDMNAVVGWLDRLKKAYSTIE